MYRRSVITDEISQDLNVVLDVARSFKLAGLEIRTIGDTRVDNLSPSQVRELRQAADAAGLAICAVAPPFYKCDIDNPSERQEHLEILRRTIDVGQRLGTNLIRTFTFWKGPKLADVWDRVVDSYQEPVAIARQSGAILAVENEYACLIGTGRELARFVAAVNQPEVKALWDPCNALFDDAGEAPFPDGYQAVRGQIIHVHLKDAKRTAPGAKPVLTPLTEGQIGIADQLAALVADGYDGFISLETHWRPEALDESTVRLPGGRAFSEKAAQATIYCLKKWDEIPS